MYVLDKLWQGKLSPREQCFNYGSEYSELANGISYPLQEAGAQLNIRMKDDSVFLIEYYVE